ncbi:MAG: type II secretion system GspH family protein, partial [Actinomycetota bacterium]|nr:type II secretion system GspH family protein [Actinomycetota bacterium]
ADIWGMRTSSPIFARRFRSRLTRLQDEEGFTLVEAMAALSILAIGIFAAAQALTAGLLTTGLSRQKLAARSALDQQMEDARTLNYDNLVLSDASPLTHSTTSTNPDYWVDQNAQTYDPDGSGPLTAEPLVRVAGASPALQHYQNPLVVGSTTYTVYRYVTWVDSPTDGTVTAGNDAADGNHDGVSDAGGQDEKRVTVVVTWNDEFGRGTTSQTQSSLFTDGKVVYTAPAKNTPPTVSCPSVSSITDRTVTLSAVTSDPDGTIASVGWTFNSGSTVLGTASGTTATFTFPGYATYSIVNTVVDNGGGSSTNSSLNCSVTTVNPLIGNGGPDGTVVIAGGATYTNTTIVTLTIAKTGGGNPTQMQLSNDGTTWNPKVAFNTSASWTLLTGEGTKTVYIRLFDSSGRYGTATNDTIVLDTTPPGAPTNFVIASSSTSGSNKTLTFTWSAPSGVADLGGYRVWGRLITSTGAFSLVCDTSSTTCSHTHKKTDTYEYYVQAYDLATNVGPQSAAPNPTG